MSLYKKTTHEFRELSIPEPSRRNIYYGHVVRVERFYHRIKPLKIKGKVRYGTVQIVFPKDCVERPVYIIAYVLTETEKFGESPIPMRSGRLPLEKIV